MARLTAVNFTGPLQFPYASAATDLFKKEDVQTLAVAVDAHDHSAGKGLAIAAAAIPNGLITSAMIADGTITSADIGFGQVTGGNIAASTIANANIASATITGDRIATGTIVTSNIAVNNVQNLVGQYSAVPSFSTTTLSTWVATPITVTIACTGRPLRITGQVSLQHSATAGLVMVAIAQNGTPISLVGQFNSPGVNYSQQIAWTTYVTPTAGTYTFAVYVQTVNAGTLSIVASVQAALYVTEELR